MPPFSLSDLVDDLAIAVDNVAERILGGSGPTLRLGVTGLSRSGKTIFISALVHNLIHGGRLPLFPAYAQGRLARAYLSPQPDDDVPRFAYEDHIRTLIDDRLWPESTRRISELRLVIEYESAQTMKRTFGPGRLTLDIVDYPGEWLLDLALLPKSYAAWSAETVAQAREPHRAPLARDWLALIDAIPADASEDEQGAKRLAEAFQAYLRSARADEHALSMLPPGRFLMPGDLEGSPALTFSPLAEVGASAASSLAAMMERRYEAYKSHVVKPFFREHFARLDRQIVLVDMLAALNSGPAAVRDLQAALTDVLSAFRPGRSNWLSSFLLPRIDRILFAATKADHVPHSDHDRLARLLDRLVVKAAQRASFAGAKIETVALAAVRATREAEVTRAVEKLPVLTGTPMPGETVGGEPYDGKTDIALFPGDLDDDPESLFRPKDDKTSQAAALRYLRFRPPALERTASGATLSLPHIRLDRALDFLIGDRLT